METKPNINYADITVLSGHVHIMEKLDGTFRLNL